MTATNVSTERPPHLLIVGRLNLLRAAMAEKNTPALLVTGNENKGWVSAFSTGVFVAPGGAILVTQDTAVYITSHVDYEECLHGVPHMSVVPYEWQTEELHDRVVAVVASLGLKSVAVEAPHITVAEADKYADLFEKAGIELVRGQALVTPLRARKDEWEIEQTRQAHRVTARALEETLQLLRPGVTEWEIASELEYRLRRYGSGSSRLAFQSIVASGPNSALPHASVSHREVQSGDFVKFDFGATWNGYCADCTRTVVVGKASERQRSLYNAVLAAQLAAIESMANGVACTQVDSIATRSMSESGFGDYIGHSLGHGVGLQVHENPWMSPRSEDMLAPGHIVTVEPGLYIAGFGGVRIEDNILILEDGIENLTLAPKELLEL